MKRKQLFILATISTMLFTSGCSIVDKVPNYNDPLLALNKIEVDFSFLDDTKDLYAECFYDKQNITFKSTPLGFNNEVIFKSFLKESSYYVTKGGPGGTPVSSDLFYIKYSFASSNNLSFYLYTILNNRNEIYKEKLKKVVYEDGHYSFNEGYYLYIGGNALKLKENYKEYEGGNDYYICFIKFKDDKSFNEFIDFLKDTTFID